MTIDITHCEEDRCSICTHTSEFHYGKNGENCDLCRGPCIPVLPAYLSLYSNNKVTIDITYHESAGIDGQGNYYRGHLHPHHSGNFITSDLRRGYFCCAPIVDGKCSDPCPEIRTVHLYD